MEHDGGGNGKRSAKLIVSKVGDEPGFMDPKLWGNLKIYIDLATHVFAKLPLREFFQSRLVCREWNGLAGDRKFLEEANPKPMQKPYFHLCRYDLSDSKLLFHGLLTYTSWRKEWSYVSLGQRDVLRSIVAVEGIVCLTTGGDHSVLRVFNTHSRVWYTLPQLEPEVQLEGNLDLPVVALKVDTATYPYEFLVIRAGAPNSGSPTSTFDSRTNTWTVCDQESMISETGSEYTPFRSTCAQVSDAIYVHVDEIWSSEDDILCYKNEDERWYSLDVAEFSSNAGLICGIGAWKEKVYYMSQVFFGDSLNSGNFEIIMSVEDEQTLGAWEEFDRMPQDLRHRLLENPDSEIHTNYCDGLVLICSYSGGDNNRFGFFNLDTKVWEMAGIPDGLVQPLLDDEESTGESESDGIVMWDPLPANKVDLTEEKSSVEASGSGECQVKENQPASLDKLTYIWLDSDSDSEH